MIKSFGCSFFYGSDLGDCTFQSSNLTWPALIAQHKNLDYCCYAKPGNGNLFILNSILEQTPGDDLFLINWTWIDRYDYINSQDETWAALRPAEDNDLEKFYFRHLHSQYKDMLTNLGYIKLAIDYLNDNRIKFVMTYMDYLLFEPINPNWHNPGPVSYLQNKIRPHLVDFDGSNFLDWSKKSGYQVSKHWHPLEQAHAAAAQFILNQSLV
jgi:hypothetical protein